MQKFESDSLFYRLARLVTVGELAAPLGLNLLEEDLVEEAVQKLHKNALNCICDPVDRVSLVFSGGKLKGWTRFDILSVSEHRFVRDEVMDFGEKQIIAGNISVMSIVDLFGGSDNLFYFVINGDSICGTVKYTDLFSDGFRLCLFALSLQIEESSLKRLAVVPEASFLSLPVARQEAARLVVGGHPKCTTFGHLKVHHFLDGKTGSD